MNQLEQSLKIAEQYCKDNGERFTKNRQLILQALLETDKAISAYELVEYCKQHFSKVIPVMSVYRILDFFKTHGFAHRLDLANKYVACPQGVCEHKDTLSQFLICDQCQRVEEIHIDQSAINNLQQAIQKTGFHLTTPQLEVNGICDKCYTPSDNSNDLSI